MEANTLEFIYKPTDLNELVRGIEETMRSKVQQGVVLNYTLGAADCCIESEPNRLSQVIINLLTMPANSQAKEALHSAMKCRMMKSISSCVIPD